MSRRKYTTFRFLVLVMAIAAIASFSLFASAQGVIIDNTYEQLMLLQEDAVAANELLNEAFGHDAVGNITFPNDFAGARIEENKLVLSLTDTDIDNTTKYLNWVGDYADCLVFEKVEFSYNDLMDAAAEAAHELKELGYPITQYYVSETNNDVVIGMNFNDISYQNSVLSSTRSETLATDLSDEHNVPIRFENIAPTTATMTNAIATLRGGAKITNITANCSMTLSCCGSYGGVPAILTCGHGGQSPNDIIKYASSSGSTIGNVYIHRYYDGDIGDFEIIKITNTDTFSTSNSINNTYSITGTLSSPAVGTIIKYYSRTTSSFGYGSVERRNVTVLADDRDNISGLTEVKVTSGSCESGDSGGPFFQDASSGAKYCGVLHGNRTDSSGNMYVYFTPYTYISSAGFSVRTS